MDDGTKLCELCGMHKKLNIGPAGALAGDHGTALEQQSHHKTSSFVLISVGIIPLFAAAHNIKSRQITHPCRADAHAAQQVPLGYGLFPS